MDDRRRPLNQRRIYANIDHGLADWLTEYAKAHNVAAEVYIEDLIRDMKGRVERDQRNPRSYADED